MSIAGIYCIENIYNGKMYIGSSFDLNARIVGHKSLLRNGKSHNNHLQSAYNKYGADAFLFYVIEVCPKDKAKEREQFWIDNTSCFKSGYNASNKVLDNSGWNHTEGLKERLSKERMGEGNPQYGKKLTAEQKDFLRISSTGKRHTPIAIEKMINNRANNKHKYVGSKSGKAKLCEREVYEIKKLIAAHNLSFNEIALQFNISLPVIGGIFSGRRWSHVACEELEKYKETYVVDSRQTGEQNINAKLTSEDVIEIRKIEGKSYAAIGRIYNVSDVTISNIIKMKIWKNVV